MNISVRELTRQSDSEWFAELEIGDSTLRSTIYFRDDGDLQSFQIAEPILMDLLALCGLEGEFSRRFFSFIGNRTPELPWCFGEQDKEVIERVRRHYGDEGECH